MSKNKDKNIAKIVEQMEDDLYKNFDCPFDCINDCFQDTTRGRCIKEEICEILAEAGWRKIAPVNPLSDDVYHVAIADTPEFKITYTPYSSNTNYTPSSQIDAVLSAIEAGDLNKASDIAKGGAGLKWTE